jgi:hypothetical protein
MDLRPSKTLAKLYKYPPSRSKEGAERKRRKREKILTRKLSVKV